MVNTQLKRLKYFNTGENAPSRRLGYPGVSRVYPQNQNIYFQVMQPSSVQAVVYNLTVITICQNSNTVQSLKNIASHC